MEKEGIATGQREEREGCPRQGTQHNKGLEADGCKSGSAGKVWGAHRGSDVIQ